MLVFGCGNPQKSGVRTRSHTNGTDEPPQDKPGFGFVTSRCSKPFSGSRFGINRTIPCHLLDPRSRVGSASVRKGLGSPIVWILVEER